jgi:hypothetical protein
MALACRGVEGNRPPYLPVEGPHDLEPATVRQVIKKTTPHEPFPHATTCTLTTGAAACTGGGTYLGDATTCAPIGHNGAMNACCPSDSNNSGALEVADIFAFLNAWFAGCPQHDRGRYAASLIASPPSPRPPAASDR